MKGKVMVSWSYYDLEQKLTHKAPLAGRKVVNHPAMRRHKYRISIMTAPTIEIADFHGRFI